MTFINDETPTWVIDWVNKVYTFANDIWYFTNIRYDWADTTNYTVNGKVVTLSYAPLYSIVWDYYTWIAENPVETDCTFWNIKTKVWALLGAKSTSTNFSDKIVWDEINMRGREIWKGRVVNKLNPRQLFRAWKLYFKDSNFLIRIKWGWVLTWTVEIWDTTITLDTTNLLTSGYIDLWWDIIKYTGKTATEISWVTGITVNHLVWEKAIQLYEAPVNIDKPTTVEYWNSELTRDWVRNYEIIRDNSTLLFRINWISSDELVKVNYVRKFENMGTNTDKCPFPEDYWTRVLAYMVAWSLGYDKGIPNSQNILNSGYNSLQEMYWDIGSKTNIIKQSIKPRFTPKMPI